MKKILLMVLTVALALSMVGCGSKKIDTSAVVPSEILDKIQTDLELPALTPMADENVVDFYKMNMDDIKEYAIGKPMMNVHATEVMVIRAVDEKAAANIVKALEEYGTSSEEQWATYLPDQYELVKARTLETKGDIVYYVVAQDNKKIVDIINSYIK